MTTSERWERAQHLFDAKDYVEAAKLLTEVVAETPDQTGPRLLLARAYYHSAQPPHRSHPVATHGHSPLTRTRADLTRTRESNVHDPRVQPSRPASPTLPARESNPPGTRVQQRR
jgi:hypothetical protein